MTLTFIITTLLFAGLCLTWRFLANSFSSNQYTESYRGDNSKYEEVY